jgi:hypothetical protein
MEKVKNILFRVNLKGNGIVNFDDSSQKFMYNGTNLNSMKTMYDNTSYAKKRFYKDVDGNLTYKICISSDCLRHDIFKEDILNQSPNIINNEAVLYSFIASPANLLRGYLFADKKETYKRKGAITITDAEQTCNAVSYIETFSRSGLKNQDSDKADNSFYKKETIGNIKYSTIGNIDLMQLQFVSVDQIFDRFSFNPDSFELYKAFLKTKLENFNSELGYFQIESSVIDIPEYGFKFSNENVNKLVQEFFTRLLKLNILRKNAYANIESIEYKLVYDVIEDTFDTEDGWLSIKNEFDIKNINIIVEDFYVSVDESNAKKLRNDIELDYEKRKKEAKDKKSEEVKNKKEAKDKK